VAVGVVQEPVVEVPEAQAVAELVHIKLAN
jgi:hypothetical protein